MTSDGLGFANPPAGFSHLFALAPDCSAIAHLRSVKKGFPIQTYLVHTFAKQLAEAVMALRSNRDMTIEEFNQWSDARRDVQDVMEATAEEGGPRVSMVPEPTSVPVDFLPDAVQLPAPASPPGVVPFKPEPSRKVGGWSAERQRLYIETLAETGSVHLAAKTAGLSARSAYALRVRSPAFSAAWDAAQQLAVGRLSALAFDRAIHGRIEQVYHQGELVGEKRVPSERLLMWLLARLDPNRFAAPWERQKDGAPDPQAAAQKAFPAMLLSLTDQAAD